MQLVPDLQGRMLHAGAGTSEEETPQGLSAELGLGVLSWGVRWAALDHGSRVDT